VAGKVRADENLGRGWGSGAEVRIEGEEAVQVIQRYLQPL
jgi:hypothetical protein